jgi:hypothetical protein
VDTSTTSPDQSSTRGRPRKLWAGIEVDWFRNPQVRRLSSDAKLLFIAARLYASEHLTDGRIERDAVEMIAIEAKVSLAIPLSALVNSLLAAGLWEEEGESYHDVEFIRANQTAKQRLRRWQQQRDWRDAHEPKDRNIDVSLSASEIEIETETEIKNKDKGRGTEPDNEALCKYHGPEYACDFCRVSVVA